MLEKKKVQESLDRHVFSENPFDEKMKARFKQGVKGSKFKRNNFPLKPAISICALMAAAAIFIFFISQNSWKGPGGSSSASWAYAFVKLNGETYVITDETVPAVGKQLGVVTSSSDREAADTSGNFSNAVEKGTKMYSIPGVLTEKAIAVEQQNGPYIKAISRDVWVQKNLKNNTNESETMESFLDPLKLYKGITIEEISDSNFAELFPNGEAAKVTTNIGTLDVVIFSKEDHSDVSVSNVSSREKNGRYNYLINGESINSPREIFFMQYSHYLIMTKSKALADVINIEKNLVEQSVIDPIEWEPSPFFNLMKDYAVRGEQGKLAVKTTDGFYAGQSSKCLWFFWDVEPFENNITVVAVKKGTRVRAKALTRPTSSKYWSTEGVGGPLYGADATIISGISLPSSGLWSLNVFHGDQYLGDIVVEVEKRISK
ncbi:MAG TPA: DUF4871 domain-containing protein [Bacillales bacterium]|nr:DUF4871 domain-containing protein [Bacillales bacterium]